MVRAATCKGDVQVVVDAADPPHRALGHGRRSLVGDRSWKRGFELVAVLANMGKRVKEMVMIGGRR